jgi:hypothetical protein
MFQNLDEGLVLLEIFVEGLVRSLPVLVEALPSVVKGDEDVAGAFKTVCDALDLL